MSPCLPADFQFSQSVLRDYQECPQRFRHRYLDHRAWPAAVSEPALEHERRMLRGDAFHRLVQQHQAGIDASRLSQMLDHLPDPPDEDCLREWWENYLAHPPAGLTGQRYVEYALTTRVAGYRLLARFDLLQIQCEEKGGMRGLIIDWKTSARPRNLDRTLSGIQTRVYRFVLARAGAVLAGGQPLQPEQIQMVYWYAETPKMPLQILYNDELFADDERLIAGLIDEISTNNPEDFGQAVDDRYCKYCVYRSLCGRGVRAGAGSPEDDDHELGSLPESFESIEEIRF